MCLCLERDPITLGRLVASLGRLGLSPWGRTSGGACLRGLRGLVLRSWLVGLLSPIACLGPLWWLILGLRS